MNSIVERLRALDREYKPCRLEAADLIEAQDQRIKELGQQVSDLETECAVHAICTKARVEELAALRKRIADAPVVGYVRYEVGIRPTFVPVTNGKCEVSIPKLAEFTALISKEDLL